MLILSVSVHPAMAAEAINEEYGNCATCGTGMDDLSSIPGLESRNVPTVNIREISLENSPATPGGRMTGASVTVSGTQKRHLNAAVTLDIRDPFSGNTAAVTTRADATAGITDDPVTPVIANMSREGYDLTAESSHRYESTVTADDLLSLNSSQRAALDAEGFSFTGDDTVLSYRDVTYYTFTNRTTQSRVYLMAVQRLDTGGTPVGDRELALSPEFSASGARAESGFYGVSAAGGSSCVWEWVSVTLAAVGLIANIVILIVATDGTIGPYVLSAITTVIASITFGPHRTGGQTMSVAYKIGAALPYIRTLAILTGLVLLIVLLYSIYKLGLCMGWWTSGDEILWSYQYRFNETANGDLRQLALHDRFALSLFADTRVDEDAHWMVESHTGLIIKSEEAAKTENGTLQSWLVEAPEAGSQEFILKYVTSEPIPPVVAGPAFALRVSVDPGEWKITTIADDTGDGAGPYPSLLVDPSGIPHISFYNGKQGQIVYGERTGNSWTLEPVAESDGTYSTSLALDPSGNPAISFGDGLHYGNLMYAQKNGTQWDVTRVDSGSAGDAGQYSSLAFDAEGNPHITYNDGQHFASLKYATWNGSAWEIATIDRDGLTGDTGYGSSLVLDTAGHPRVAYTNGKYFADLMYATDDGSGFTTTRVDDGGGRTKSTGFDPSLSLDSRGSPHISYYDDSNGDLRYASWNGTGWDLETIDSINDVGRHPSLAIDAGDHPHISYYDASYKELRYATYDTNSAQWVIRTIDTGGDVGSFSSIALDSSGRPCISYYDAVNHAVKYASTG